MSGVPLNRWPEADVAASGCTAGTPDCPVNFSRRRLKNLRAKSWAGPCNRLSGGWHLRAPREGWGE
jgi:hypothetical protein